MTQNLEHGREPAVTMTFDDGPDPVWTPRVLEALRRARARATFFVITPRACRYPDLIAEILGAGHGVEFHCVEHTRHTERTRDEVAYDTCTGLRDLRSLGVTPRFWRTPWGVRAPWTEVVAERFGLELVPWTADTHDWRGDTAAEMLEQVGPLLRPGAIVLLHDGLGPGARRAGCEETVALIEPLVERIRALGCEPAQIKPRRKILA